MLSGEGDKVEPYFCLNFGTGILDEALAWVEYCNGTENTYYANLRRKHGREEPYGIKYWALGNEVSQPWFQPSKPTYLVISQLRDLLLVYSTKIKIEEKERTANRIHRCGDHGKLAK